jgi:hypothetical protein
MRATPTPQENPRPTGHEEPLIHPASVPVLRGTPSPAPPSRVAPRVVSRQREVAVHFLEMGAAQAQADSDFSNLQQKMLENNGKMKAVRAGSGLGPA